MVLSDETLLRLAIRNGRIVSIDEVENGKVCGCVCAQCGAALIAKNNGKVKQHHFAHESDSDCKGAIESALHLLAKDILLANKKIFIPHYKHFFSEFQREPIIVPYAKCLSFDKVTLEERIKIDDDIIIADAVCEIKEKKIIVEFAKSHFIDDRKKEKLRRLGIACIEIPISLGTQDREKFTTELLSNALKPIWIINKKGEQLVPIVYERLKKEFDERNAKNQEQEEQERAKLLEMGKINEEKRNALIKLQQATKEKELDNARKKGNLIKVCPIQKELRHIYYSKLLGLDPIVKKLSAAKEISDIYEKPEFVDVFLDGEREILIPENYFQLSKDDQLKCEAKLNTVRKFLTYRNNRNRNFCNSCTFFHGIVHEFIICSCNPGQRIDNSLIFY
ncbi:competence protein CoiA family protein [Ferruginibacter sp. HRS2-29]|uniref:competence protein CoiA family protein n=1 Tax=Ferruginibacter sp. HRS2-29 TaxID=2487334 RepID=UPI0020CD1B99|nr:competence protein CoiA family protein [Ferruginibacter sp. HRS2-29]